VISFVFQKFATSSMKTRSFKFHFVSLLHGTKSEAFVDSFIIGSFGYVELCCQPQSANKSDNVVHLFHVPNS
jgi:hypothetical protein